MRQRSLAALLAAVVLGSVLAPLGAAAVGTDDGDGVGVEATSGDGAVVVSVAEDGSAATNATVTVAPTDPDRSYAGSGEYETDADGTVDLPEPDLEEGETLRVSIVATTASGTDEIRPTFYVESDGADENGTDGNVSDGNDSTDEYDDAVDDLRNLTESLPFGSLVSAFVDEQRYETAEPLGPRVSAFVAAFTPVDLPAHAGPPDHAGSPAEIGSDAPRGERGPPTDDDRGPPISVPGQSDDREPPADAGPGADDGNGPPAHAGA